MYWGVFTVIIVSPWSLKVLTNMHKFSIIFYAVLLFFVLKMNYLFSRIECCYKIHIKLRCPEFNSPYINRKRKPPLLRVMVFFF